MPRITETCLLVLACQYENIVNQSTSTFDIPLRMSIETKFDFITLRESQKHHLNRKLCEEKLANRNLLDRI